MTAFSFSSCARPLRTCFVPVCLGFATAALLAACASLILPRTPEQVVFASVKTYASVKNETARQLDAGILGADRAEYVQARLADVRPMLNTASATVRGGGEVGDTTLALVRVIQRRLIELQLELQQPQAMP